MSIAPGERDELLDDVRRAAGWLRASLDALPDVSGAFAAASSLSLGLAIAAELLADAQAQHDAREAVRSLAARLDANHPDGAEYDALVLALGGALRRDDLDQRQRARVRAACDTGFAAGARRGLADGLAGALRAAQPAAVRLDTALLERIAFGTEADVLDVCDQVELAGIGAAADAGARREAGLMLAARAFSAARAPRFGAFALRLLRVVVAEALDAPAVGEALQYARGLQRVDGAYGYLPVRTRNAGDIRYVLHVPMTVDALWIMHDALAPQTLVRRAMRTPIAGRKRSGVSQERGHHPGR